MRDFTTRVCLYVGVMAWVTNSAIAQFYVDSVSGNDSNTGTTWATALRTLQKGIDSASVASPPNNHVLVREGLYGPSQANASGDIDLKDFAQAHGGFINSTTWSDPDGSFLQTSIRGLLPIPGQGDLDTESIIESINNSDVTLDGFLVHEGDQDANDNHAGFGGAFYCQNPDQVKLENITFKQNWAEVAGGAIATKGGWDGENHGLEIDRCTFYNNDVGVVGAPGTGAGIFLGPDFSNSAVKMCNAVFRNLSTSLRQQSREITVRPQWPLGQAG